MTYRVVIKWIWDNVCFDFNNGEAAVLFANSVMDHIVKDVEDDKRKKYKGVVIEIIDPNMIEEEDD